LIWVCCADIGDKDSRVSSRGKGTLHGSTHPTNICTLGLQSILGCLLFGLQCPRLIGTPRSLNFQHGRTRLVAATSTRPCASSTVQEFQFNSSHSREFLSLNEHTQAYLILVSWHGTSHGLNSSSKSHSICQSSYSSQNKFLSSFFRSSLQGSRPHSSSPNLTPLFPLFLF
jgi:hypothetical protein